jgi:hypothetical protein
MPRNTAATTRTEDLPEFLRSKAIGAVIAEALDASTGDELSRPGAVTSMVADAAREIREFHDLTKPDTESRQPQHIYGAGETPGDFG